MTFEFQLNEEDVVDAQLSHLRTSLRRTNRAAAVAFGVILLLAIIACVSWFVNPPRQKELWPWVLACVVGVLAAALWALYLGSGIPYRKQFRKTRALQMPMKIVVDGNQVQYTSANGESRLMWTAFEDFRESRKNFLLYTQRNLFFILPKRVFSAEEISEFRGTLETHIRQA